MLDEFELWADSVEDGMPSVNLATLQECLEAVRLECSETSVLLLLRQAAFLRLHELYERLISKVLPLRGPLAQFWLSYIKLVHLALQFVGDAREGN